MGSAFLMKKAENHCGNTFYLQSPFSISAYLDRLVSHYNLVPPIVRGHCYISMSEFDVIILQCEFYNKGGCRGDDVPAAWPVTFHQTEEYGIVFCGHFLEKNAGTILVPVIMT